MNNISTYEESFSSLIPEFQNYWNSGDCLFNRGAESSVHGIFIAFSHMVCEKLESTSLENTGPIFKFIEATIKKGGSSANAACTCFLESVLNRTSITINPELFVSFLGEESKKFCRAWSDFTGVEIVGIDNQE